MSVMTDGFDLDFDLAVDLEKAVGAGTISSYGAVAASVFLSHLAAEFGLRPVAGVVGVAFPMLFALLLVVAGAWTLSRAVSARNALRLGAWTTLGVLAIGAIGVLAYLHQRTHGVAVADAPFLLVNTATIGGVVGYVVGLYQVELARERTFTEHALDALPNQFVVFDTDGNPVRWNRRVNEATGYDDRAVAARTIADLFEHRGDESVESVFADILGGTPRRGVSMDLVTAGDDRVPYEFYGHPLDAGDDEVVGVSAIGIDVTDRRRRDRELRLFKKGIEQVGTQVIITGAGGEIQYVNPMFESVTGYAAEEVVGRTPAVLQSGKQPTQYYENLWATICDGETWRAEIVNERRNGEQYYVDKTITPLTDDDGAITHYLAIEKEVTERRRREQQLSVLNRVIRHNLRNSLNVILGHVQRFAEYLPAAETPHVETVQDRVAELVDLSQKASAIKHSLDATPAASPTADLVSILDRVRRDFARRHPDADITLAVNAESITVGVGIELAFVEAVENAIQHAGRGAPSVRLVVDRTERGRTLVEVTDDGPGIPDLERDAVNAAVETPLQHGQGLGLWLIKWVVDSHGGDVVFADREPTGTRVRITLPSAE